MESMKKLNNLCSKTCKSVSSANKPTGWNKISKKISAVTKNLAQLIQGMGQRY
jgi:hypothetical protein